MSRRPSSIERHLVVPSSQLVQASIVRVLWGQGRVERRGAEQRGS